MQVKLRDLRLINHLSQCSKLTDIKRKLKEFWKRL